MSKTILITGATDGIGLETAKLLAHAGHDLVLHGRSEAKLEQARADAAAQGGTDRIATRLADLSTIAAVDKFADDILRDELQLDVLINNAGVFTSSQVHTSDGLDIRLAVNTVAPYILARKLAPLLGKKGRIINLSSAAQASVNIEALAQPGQLSDNEAYAQSKLAITMWTRELADRMEGSGPMIVAVNPASLLGSKMVKDAYGMDGKDLSIGAKILVRAALSDEFADAGGRYFDNDSSDFASPHPDALDPMKNRALVDSLEQIIARHRN